MARYAEGTSVDVGRSEAELKNILTRYGARSCVTGWDRDTAFVGFQTSENHYMVRISMDLPKRSDPEFHKTPTGKRRDPNAAETAWEKEVRRRWRALVLVVKAKLEAVESEVTSFEEEFLPFIVLPDGSTSGEFLIPQIKEAYRSGAMPSALLLPPQNDTTKRLNSGDIIDVEVEED